MIHSLGKGKQLAGLPKRKIPSEIEEGSKRPVYIVLANFCCSSELNGIRGKAKAFVQHERHPR